MNRPALLSAVILVAWAFCGIAAAATIPSSGPLATSLGPDDLDRAAFAEWVDGIEQPMTVADGPRHVVWTTGSQPQWDGVGFGESKNPGPRHLRLGWKKPMPVGCVLVRGGGQLSVLRPEAAYPGDLGDAALWLTAQRLDKRQTSDAEAAHEDYAVWVLPPGTVTRALRLTHTARPVDERFAGWLGGAYVLSTRWINVAPRAAVVTESNAEAAGRINDENDNRIWQAWDNGAEGADKPVSADHPVDVVLAWPGPTPVRGLVALTAGFAAAEVQVFEGPAGRRPSDADAQWRTVAQWSGLENQYPRALGANFLDLGQTVTTRGIRLRITRPTAESHSHLTGKTKQGKRVWLGELMTLEPLGDTPLVSAVMAEPEPAAAARPPIPVAFTLDAPGYVTLVIDDAEGRRVRNLVSETRFPAGRNVVWWDGTDDLGRDPDAARHGIYRIPARLVPPGEYRVAGLVHPGVDLRFEFSIYTGGNPAWSTADHTGGWLTNHTPPSSAMFVPGRPSSSDKLAGEPMVYLGSYISEGGSGLAWVDLDGHKRGGVGWVGGAWTGAPFLAHDAGRRAAADVHVYVGSAWEGELRLTAMIAQGERSVLKQIFPGGKHSVSLAGMAVRNGLMVCSLPTQKQLLWVDALAGKSLGTAPMDDPRGLAFDDRGRLLVLAGKQLRRYGGVSPSNDDAGAPNAPATLPPPEVLVDGLEDPQHVTIDTAGNLYVSDRGSRHQVLVFDPAGKPLRAIGTPGTPKPGPYDPNHMNNPNGLTIDSRDRLWVAETDFQPKRVSVWTLDGRLVRAFYGPGEYGGGGTLDPEDKTRFYYHGMEFQLDWEHGTDRLVRVFSRPGPGDLELPKAALIEGQPGTAIYVGQPGSRRRYFTNCYTYNPTNGASLAVVWLDRDGIAVPVAASGRAADWPVLKTDAMKSRWPKGVDLTAKNYDWLHQAMFVWSDLNGDGQVQPCEVQMVKASTGGITVMPDLSMAASRVDRRAMLYRPQRFTDGGVPVYDLAAGQPLADDVEGPVSSGGDQALVDPAGWTVLTVAPKPFPPQSLTGVYLGQPRWAYPSLWPGLHASHESPPPDRPGEVIGTTRLLGGLIRPGGEAGPLWAVNGNMGNIYLFTVDGLFVTEMFHDIRQGVPWAMPAAPRGMRLNDLSLHDENFWPSITQTADGSVYLVDGGRTSLIRVDGLERIRRLPPSRLRVTADDLRRAADYLVRDESQRQQRLGRPTLRVPRLAKAPTVDGSVDDWPDAQWVTIDRAGVAAFFDSKSKPYDVTATVALAGDRLYAAFRTGDPKLLQNSGETPLAPFKTGGALDLMIGARGADPDRAAPVEGDLRLLVTRVKGKTLALVYRPVVPGTARPVPFSSPWRTVPIDRVDDVSDQVELADAHGNFELSIPLAALHLDGHPGRLLGDLGILRGNGFETLHRVYWSNKATAITSDVPSEATLTPNLWGHWIVGPQ